MNRLKKDIDKFKNENKKIQDLAKKDIKKFKKDIYGKESDSEENEN